MCLRLTCDRCSELSTGGNYRVARYFVYRWAVFHWLSRSAMVTLMADNAVLTKVQCSLSHSFRYQCIVFRWPNMPCVLYQRAMFFWLRAVFLWAKCNVPLRPWPSAMFAWPTNNGPLTTVHCFRYYDIVFRSSKVHAPLTNVQCFCYHRIIWLNVQYSCCPENHITLTYVQCSLNQKRPLIQKPMCYIALTKHKWQMILSQRALVPSQMTNDT